MIKIDSCTCKILSALFLLQAISLKVFKIVQAGVRDIGRVGMNFQLLAKKKFQLEIQNRSKLEKMAQKVFNYV